MTIEWTCVGDGLHVARMPDGRELRVFEATAAESSWSVGRLDSLSGYEAGDICDTAEQAKKAAERAWAEMQPSVAPAEQPMPTPSEHPAIVDLLIASIQARAAKGLATYGQPLRAFNGRDPLRDLEEEMLDGAMYARQLREEWDALRAERDVLRAENEKLRRSVDLHRLTLDEERRCHGLTRTELARLTAEVAERDAVAVAQIAAAQAASDRSSP